MRTLLSLFRYAAPCKALFCLYVIFSLLMISFIIGTTTPQTVTAQTQARFVAPSANDVLPAGASFTVRWRGVEPEDTLRLEYSADKGATWNLVTAKAAGLQYQWQPLPPDVGTGCLLRLVPLRPQNVTQKILRTAVRLRGTFSIFSGEVGFDDGSIPPLPSPLTQYTERAIFSPDGTTVLSCLASSGSGGGSLDIEFQIATFLTSQRDGCLPVLWDARTGIKIRSLPSLSRRSYARFGYNWGATGQDESYKWFSATQWWSPNGTQILYPVSDSLTIVLDATTYQPRCSLRVPQGGAITSADRFVWTPDNQRVVGIIHHFYPATSPMSFYKYDSLTTDRVVWDARTGDVLSTSSQRTQDGSTCDYGQQLSNDRTRVMTWRTSAGGAITINDVATGRILQQYMLPNGYYLLGSGSSAGGSRGTPIGDGRFWSPNDTFVYLHIAQQGTQANPKIVIWNTATGAVAHVIESPLSVAFQRGSWSPQSDKFYYQTNFLRPEPNPNRYADSTRCFIVDIAKQQSQPLTESLANILETRSNEPYTFSHWRPDGKRLAIRYGDDRNRSIGIWDTEHNEFLYYFTLPTYFSTIQWDPSGKRMMAVARDSLLRYIVDLPEPLQGDTSAVFSIRDVGRLDVPPSVLFPPLLCAVQQTTTLALRNAGAQAISVTGFEVIGANKQEFTSSLQPPFPLAAGTQQAVELTFTPSINATGDKTAALLVRWRDAVNSEHTDTVQIAARSDRSAFTVADTTLDCSTTMANTATTATFTLTNTGTLPLSWQTPIIKGLFTLESIQPNPTPAGGQSLFSVRFAGGAFGTQSTERLDLKDACGRATTVTLTASVQPPAPAISTADTLPFGRLLCQPSAERLLTITNSGGKPLVVDSVAVESTTSFTVTGFTKPFVVEGNGGTKTISVAFTPIADGSAAARLHIRSNAANAPERIIILTAEKQSAGLRFSPASLDLGNTAEQQPLTQTITLENTGSIPHWLSLPLVVSSTQGGTQSGTFTLESASVNPILPHGTTAVRVRFAGVSAGIYTTQTSVPDSCNRPTTLALTARVIAGEIAMPDTIALAPAQQADFPIFLRKRSGVDG